VAGSLFCLSDERGLESSRKRRIRHDERRYRDRWLIEAMFCRLKDFRRWRPVTTSSRPTSCQRRRSPLSSHFGAECH